MEEIIEEMCPVEEDDGDLSNFQKDGSNADLIFFLFADCNRINAM